MDNSGITCSLEIDHPYPPTKIMWSPSSLNMSTEYLATTADYLRLWSVNETAIEHKMTIADVSHAAIGADDLFFILCADGNFVNGWRSASRTRPHR